MLEMCIGSAKEPLLSIGARALPTDIAWMVQGKEIIAFERHLSLLKKGGNHCHINVVPIPATAAPKCKQVRPPLPPSWLCCCITSVYRLFTPCDLGIQSEFYD